MTVYGMSLSAKYAAARAVGLTHEQAMAVTSRTGVSTSGYSGSSYPTARDITLAELAGRPEDIKSIEQRIMEKPPDYFERAQYMTPAQLEQAGYSPQQAQAMQALSPYYSPQTREFDYARAMAEWETRKQAGEAPIHPHYYMWTLGMKAPADIETYEAYGEKGKELFFSTGLHRPMYMSGIDPLTGKISPSWSMSGLTRTFGTGAHLITEKTEKIPVIGFVVRAGSMGVLDVERYWQQHGAMSWFAVPCTIAAGTVATGAGQVVFKGVGSGAGKLASGFSTKVAAPIAVKYPTAYAIGKGAYGLATLPARGARFVGGRVVKPAVFGKYSPIMGKYTPQGAAVRGIGFVARETAIPIESRLVQIPRVGQFGAKVGWWRPPEFFGRGGTVATGTLFRQPAELKVAGRDMPEFQLKQPLEYEPIEYTSLESPKYRPITAGQKIGTLETSEFGVIEPKEGWLADVGLGEYPTITYRGVPSQILPPEWGVARTGGGQSIAGGGFKWVEVSGGRASAPSGVYLGEGAMGLPRGGFFGSRSPLAPMGKPEVSIFEGTGPVIEQGGIRVTTKPITGGGVSTRETLEQQLIRLPEQAREKLLIESTAPQVPSAPAPRIFPVVSPISTEVPVPLPMTVAVPSVSIQSIVEPIAEVQPLAEIQPMTVQEVVTQTATRPSTIAEPRPAITPYTQPIVPIVPIIPIKPIEPIIKPPPPDEPIPPIIEPPDLGFKPLGVELQERAYGRPTPLSEWQIEGLEVYSPSLFFKGPKKVGGRIGRKRFKYGAVVPKGSLVNVKAYKQTRENGVVGVRKHTRGFPHGRELLKVRNKWHKISL